MNADAKVGNLSGGRATAVAGSASNARASPWSLRSYYKRPDHNFQRNPNKNKDENKAPLEDSSYISSRQDIFSFSSDGDNKTRVCMVDGNEVFFTLQKNLTSKPATCREVRQRRKIQCLNVTGSPFELQCRWWLLQYSLPSITLLYFAVFLALNFIFAGLWSIQNGGCCADESLTFTQIFDFSIQTSMTIGYGGYVPEGHFANFLVVMLSCMTLILNTVYGGLLFLKFVAPRAKVEFSEVMTLSNVNGIPCLEFRIGNADGSRNLLKKVDARLTYSYTIEYTDENCAARDLWQTQELRLLHDKRIRLGEMVWTLRHMIDETSPLFGLDFREFPGNCIYHFEACIDAIQDNTGAPVFCQTAYMLEDVLIGHRFEDQMNLSEDKTVLTIDYGKFNETIPHPVWYPVNRNLHFTSRPPSNRWGAP